MRTHMNSSARWRSHGEGVASTYESCVETHIQITDTTITTIRVRVSTKIFDQKPHHLPCAYIPSGTHLTLSTSQVQAGYLTCAYHQNFPALRSHANFLASLSFLVLLPLLPVHARNKLLRSPEIMSRCTSPRHHSLRSQNHIIAQSRNDTR